jgi:hypothetical protein
MDATAESLIRNVSSIVRAVMINGEKWTNFSAEQEVATIPPRMNGEITVEISY